MGSQCDQYWFNVCPTWCIGCCIVDQLELRHRRAAEGGEQWLTIIKIGGGENMNSFIQILKRKHDFDFGDVFSLKETGFNHFLYVPIEVQMLVKENT